MGAKKRHFMQLEIGSLTHQCGLVNQNGIDDPILSDPTYLVQRDLLTDKQSKKVALLLKYRGFIGMIENNWIVDDLLHLIKYLRDNKSTDDISQMIDGYGEYAINSYVRDSKREHKKPATIEELNLIYKSCLKKLMAIQSLQTATDLSAKMKLVKLALKANPAGFISGFAIDWVLNNIDECNKLILLSTQIKFVCSIAHKYSEDIDGNQILAIVRHSLCNTRETDKFTQIINVVDGNKDRPELKGNHTKYIDSAIRLFKSYNNIADICQATRALYRNAKNEYATKYYIREITADLTSLQAADIRTTLQRFADTELSGEIKNWTVFVASLMPQTNSVGVSDCVTMSVTSKLLLIASALNGDSACDLNSKVANIIDRTSGEINPRFYDELRNEYMIPEISLSEFSSDIKNRTSDTIASISEITNSAASKLKEGSSKALHSITGIFGKSKIATEPIKTDRTLSPLETIKYLGELMEEGLLSEDEFQTQKRKLLDKI